MNNLEKEILAEIENSGSYSAIQCTKISASVCMKWIEKAFEAGSVYGFARAKGLTMNDGTRALNCSDWIIFNGLTPTEPDTKEPVVGSNGIINGEYKE